jgi:ribose-phosphate pyrophosphokinase
MSGSLATAVATAAAAAQAASAGPSGRVRVFSCNANRDLAQRVAAALGQELDPCSIEKFLNHETSCVLRYHDTAVRPLLRTRAALNSHPLCSVEIKESVRGDDVFLIACGSNPVNDNLMELLILINACKFASARRITAVLPLFPYARQDRKDRVRV